MTKITFFNSENGAITGFDCNNHSGYAEAGSDIVCAAISVLVINTINSIQKLTDSRLKVESDEEGARIRASFEATPGKDAQLLMNSLALGLSSIEENEEYSEFVDLIFEEV